MDSLLKILLALLVPVAAAVYGCASGPVVGREVLADPAMRFDPGNSIEVLDPEAQVKGKDVMRQLRARSFGDKGFSYYELNGEKIYLNLRLSRTRDGFISGDDHGTE